MMAVAFILLYLSAVSLSEGAFFKGYSDDDFNFHKCLSDILLRYFHLNKELTYVSMNSDNEDIIKTVHSINVNSLMTRTHGTRFSVSNEGYLIVAGNCKEFVTLFPSLVEEAAWNPNVRFLIIFERLSQSELTKIFTILLKYHVINVVIATVSSDPNLYTYNPFENYGCGKRYDRIIEYGKCSTTREDLYPHKLVMGLRNCTFNIGSPHWPPYTADPTRINRSDLMGAEEVILRQISTREHFKLNFTYSDDAEIYTLIENNMTAVGPMYSLQMGNIDIILGGMLLTHPRAKVFHYVWGHLAYTEDVSYQVQKATFVPLWKNMYLEFNVAVWTALIVAFVAFFVVFATLVRPRDKGRLVMQMISNFFLFSNKMSGSFFTKYIFTHWIVFAYLINVYYQSSLVDLSSNLLKEYQISNEDDIVKYKLKPCVSTVMKNYLKSVGKYSYDNSTGKGCENLLETMKTVSESGDLFTVVLRSLYYYNRYDYYDTYGNPKIYTFRVPLAKAIYAIYFYKGFPMLDRFQMQALRMRENGLVRLYFCSLQWKKNKIYHFNAETSRTHVIVPFHLLMFGQLLSSGVFLIEVSGRFMSRVKSRW